MRKKCYFPELFWQDQKNWTKSESEQNNAKKKTGRNIKIKLKTIQKKLAHTDTFYSYEIFLKF